LREPFSGALLRASKFGVRPVQLILERRLFERLAKQGRKSFAAWRMPLRDAKRLTAVTNSARIQIRLGNEVGNEPGGLLRGPPLLDEEPD
jgi:hypothetical protein